MQLPGFSLCLAKPLCSSWERFSFLLLTWFRHALPFLACGSPLVWIAFGPMPLPASLPSVADPLVVSPQFGFCATSGRSGEQQKRGIAQSCGHCSPQVSHITHVCLLAMVLPAQLCCWAVVSQAGVLQWIMCEHVTALSCSNKSGWTMEPKW